jgi:hypothetical protein
MHRLLPCSCRLWSAKKQGKHDKKKLGNITATSQRAALKVFDGKTIKWKGSHLISPHCWTIQHRFSLHTNTPCLFVIKFKSCKY